ncbi:hypothetical protein IIC44_03090 [Patescibacteria group bacterium]|nr:hypothetical protein [Patescibacteria group bacterium]
MILSGEKIAKKILENLKKKIRGKKLSLAVIQVGDNIVSKKYIEEKRKIAKKIGIGFHLINLPLSISQVKLEQQIKRTGKD